jgi:hypothetical protein
MVRSKKRSTQCAGAALLTLRHLKYQMVTKGTEALATTQETQGYGEESAVSHRYTLQRGINGPYVFCYGLLV